MLIIKLQKKKKKKTFNLVVTSTFGRKKIIEKIGTYNIFNKTLSLNIFRLIYWVSKNIFMSGNVLILFFKINLIGQSLIFSAKKKKIDEAEE